MIRLLHGDCLELMRDIPERSVDLILCDLPYGVTGCTWDNVIPFDALWAHYNRILKVNGLAVLFGTQPFTTELIHHNLKNYRYSWIWKKDIVTNFANVKVMPMRTTEDICVFYCDAYLKQGNDGQYLELREYLQSEAEKSGLTRAQFKEVLGSHMASHYFTDGKQFQLPSEGAYRKLQSTGYFKRPYSELVELWQGEKLKRERPVYNPQGIYKREKPRRRNKKYVEGSTIKKSLSGRYVQEYSGFPNNILEFKSEKTWLHPTQKPVALLEYLIKTYTNEGALVLDSCMGSCSTGVACVNTGRSFIGIEKEEKYFKIAQNRINN